MPIYLLQKGTLYQLGCMTVKIRGQSSHRFNPPFGMTLILEPQESDAVQKMILCSVTWIQSSEALYDNNVCISIARKLSPNNLNLNQINPQYAKYYIVHRSVLIQSKNLHKFVYCMKDIIYPLMPVHTLPCLVHVAHYDNH